MRSKVYFASINDRDNTEAIKIKFARLLDQSNILDFIHKDNKVAVKLHFGEEGNTGFVKPEYVRLICDRITKKDAFAVLTDTNTLYRGRRLDSESHKELAYEHSFTKKITGAPVEIVDDAEGENVLINQKFIKIAKIGKLFRRADAIVGVSHFKGHLMTGFGGALKNIGMGCALREGKLAQHSDVAPFVWFKNCVGCSECEKVCPVGAITIINRKSQIDGKRCIGCVSCIAACPNDAMDVHWEKGADNIQEKMVEYAKAALTGKEEKAAFINFAIKITKECDCLAKDDPKISKDVGIFVSEDPVSVDKASVDLVNKLCGRDIFRQVHPLRDWSKQLNYAFKIGLGNLDYELINVRF